MLFYLNLCTYATLCYNLYYLFKPVKSTIELSNIMYLYDKSKYHAFMSNYYEKLKSFSRKNHSTVEDNVIHKKKEY